MYAIIVSGGKQYRVEEGDVLKLDKLDAEAGSKVEFNEVLLVRTDDRTQVGCPVVEGACVRGVVEENGLGDKVLVFKYKKKKQYKRTLGHRRRYSAVRIEEIIAGA